MEKNLPSISYIVARSYPDNIIGCDNQLPWHLSTDLQRFRRITTGHVVVMGRKTFESIGRPLPNRINIVLSASTEESFSDNIVFVKDKNSAMYFADHYSILLNTTEWFVIGGANAYSLFSEFYNKIHLTEVFTKNIHGDAFFKHKFDGRQWKTVTEEEVKRDEKNQFPSRYTIYERKEKTVRRMELSKFMTDHEEFTLSAHIVHKKNKQIPEYQFSLSH